FSAYLQHTATPKAGIFKKYKFINKTYQNKKNCSMIIYQRLSFPHFIAPGSQRWAYLNLFFRIQRRQEQRCMFLFPTKVLNNLRSFHSNWKRTRNTFKAEKTTSMLHTIMRLTAASKPAL